MDGTTTTIDAVAAKEPAPKTEKRFYRPELDALRFFAFLAILVHHGPGGRDGFPWIVHAAGGFGLSMFFLLSAYLITELLVREREQTSTVRWGLFFIRRALRIWPLYFAALLAGFLIGHMPTRHFPVSRQALILMALFIANWSRLAPQLGALIGHLWSISIEEQFYLIWPPIIKFGGKRLAFAASAVFVILAVIWLAVFSRRGWLLWYDTPVEFLYFAAGAILALITRGGSPRVSNAARAGFLMGGLFLMGIAAYFGRVGMDETPGLARLLTRYGVSVAACALVFLALLGISHVPRALVHLGKISYGLYVFHLGALQLTERLVAPLKLGTDSVISMIVVDSIALGFTVLVAHLSYQYFEKPFIKAKERFAVIQSRPV